MAKKRLAIIGDPRIDVELMIDALGKMREKSAYYKHDADCFEETIRELSEISMPDQTPASLRRDAWHDKNK